MKLGVLHYRGRGRFAGVASYQGRRRWSRLRRFTAIFQRRVARVARELRRVVGDAAIRLALPLLLTRRVRSMKFGGTLRDVLVLVVMRIRDLVHSLGHAQVRDLTEDGRIARGRVLAYVVVTSLLRGYVSSSRRLPATLLRLAPIARRTIPILSITLVTPIRRRVPARRRRLSRVVINLAVTRRRLLLLLGVIPMHRGRQAVIAGMIGGRLVVHQGGRPDTVIGVDEGGLQRTNYRGLVVEVAR